MKETYFVIPAQKLPKLRTPFARAMPIIGVLVLLIGLGWISNGASLWFAPQTSATDGIAEQPRNTIIQPYHEEHMDKYQKPSDQDLRKQLTPVQYKVTQQEGTEPAFRNAYWDNHEAGIYVDVVSGEPLFSSLDKYDSGTGWPSFTQPLVAKNVETRTDRSLFMSRTEVHSKHAGSHLGHVFEDGPAPTGQRFCMNSASLRFVPVDKLEAEGYGAYLTLFR